MTWNPKRYEAWAENVASQFIKLSHEQKLDLLKRLYVGCTSDERNCLEGHLCDALKRNFLADLPTVTSETIVSYLDVSDLAKCAVVCRSWLKVIQLRGELWKQMLRRNESLIGDSVKDRLLHEGAAETRDDQEYNFSYRCHVLRKLHRRIQSLKAGTAFEVERELPASSNASAINVDIIGQRLVFGCSAATGQSEMMLRLWTTSGTFLLSFETPWSCSAIKLRGEVLCMGSYSGLAMCFDFSENDLFMQEYMQHMGAVFCIDFDKPNDVIVTGSADRTAKIWSLSTGQLRQVLELFPEWVTGLELHLPSASTNGFDSLSSCRRLLVQSSARLDHELTSFSIYRLSVESARAEVLYDIPVVENQKICPGSSMSTSGTLFYLTYLDLPDTVDTCSLKRNWIIRSLSVDSFELKVVAEFKAVCKVSGTARHVVPRRLLHVGLKLAAVFCDHPSFGSALAVCQLFPPRIVGYCPMSTTRSTLVALGSTDWLDGFNCDNSSGFAFASKVHENAVALCSWTCVG